MFRDRFHSCLYSGLALAVLALPCTVQGEVVQGEVVQGEAAQGATPSPLATWDPASVDGVFDATVGSGILSVTEGCVRLVLANGKTILLVWPKPTTWDAASQTIRLVDVFGERSELRDGDPIMPGGSSATGTSALVTPPDAACEADETFIVSSVIVSSVVPATDP